MTKSADILGSCMTFYANFMQFSDNGYLWFGTIMIVRRNVFWHILILRNVPDDMT